MPFELFVKILGWVMALAPLAIALGASFHLILGAANDDGEVKSVVMLGLAVTLLGVAVIVLSYFTDLFAALK